MRYQEFNERYILRFESGETLIGELKRFLVDRSIPFAFLSGAGGVRRATLRYWDAPSKSYQDRDFEEQFEVLSITGDVSQLKGKPHVHAHALLGRSDFTVLGGHVKEAEVHPTLELWLRTESIAVSRRRDPATGLELLDLPERVRR